MRYNRVIERMPEPEIAEKSKMSDSTELLYRRGCSLILFGMWLMLVLLLVTCQAATADEKPPARHVTTFSYTPLGTGKDYAGLPLIQVRLLDMNPAHVGTFVLDTGSTNLSMTESMATKLKLSRILDTANEKQPLHPGQPQYKVFLPGFQVGQLTFAGEFTLLSDKEFSEIAGQPIDGISRLTVSSELVFSARPPSCSTSPSTKLRSGSLET